MENTQLAHLGQVNQLMAGVIPPDGTILSIGRWIEIFCALPEDEPAILKQLRKDKVPHEKYAGVVFVDSTHIRRIFSHGRKTQGLDRDECLPL